MATGGLRAPNEVKSTHTKDDYEELAWRINKAYAGTNILTATANVGGICIVIWNGDVYRIIFGLEQIDPTGYEMIADRRNQMIHIK